MNANIDIDLLTFGAFLKRVNISIKNNKGDVIEITFEDPVWIIARCLANANLKSEKLDQLKPWVENVSKFRKAEEIVVLEKESHTYEFRGLIFETTEGLNSFAPELCDEGVNGTYFLKNKEGEIVAVFKPEDEQGDSIHNPKIGRSTSEDHGSLRKGILANEVASREVAAYLLDKEDHFLGVPPTVMVEINHPAFHSSTNLNAGDCQLGKKGSLQQFVDNDGAAWDVGSTLFPVKEVHKIGILDMRILNSDRHEGNILLKKTNGSYKLIPIDHGYSLPENLGNAWFDWLMWSQAKVPFDQETRAYIEKIDVDHDVEILSKELGIRKQCLMNMKISTTLLKKGAACNLTLFEIASMVCRNSPGEFSELETLCEEASDILKEVTSGFPMKEDQRDDLFLGILFSILDREINSKMQRNVQ